MEKQTTSTPFPFSLSVSFTELRLILQRTANALVTLLVIAYLTSFGLILAERGREHLPAEPLNAAGQAVLRTFTYVVDHPQTYYWYSADIPAFDLVAETLSHSAGLLLLALAVAFVLGVPLGIIAALSKRKSSSALVTLVSVLGVSTPSFLLAMLFWVVNIQVHRQFDIPVLPSGGFGWDWHLVMPSLVLAMRPMAQIAQVTYVSLSDVLRQDYIRTAQSKGLPWYVVRNRHALRNVLIPVLTTLGTSLRFSLASLPVVELFFDWPGVGQTLLLAIDQGNAPFVIDLILSLGLFFLLVNLAIELVFPLLDPRIRSADDAVGRQEHGSLLNWLRGIGGTLRSWVADLAAAFKRRATLPPLPEGSRAVHPTEELPSASRVRWYSRAFFSNPALIVGFLLVLGLAGLVFFGENLTEASPYEIHGVMMIDGEIGAPPYEPSPTFPWGTDQIGRDIQALVLAGAKRTLSLAFFGMLARLAIGIVLGMLAGWQRGGWLDRMVVGAVGVWAAFPVTLFAMILIQALGIQQGMWVFIVAISLVGWGEVAQLVRGQVIGIKPQPFIESARSVGSRSDQTLSRHVVPNLVNSLIVLAMLEMGGILMLLAELGYLNIFMGGGYRVDIGSTGRMQAVVAFFSDVPEWAALIANIRQWWRSYPWMAIYPGLAFFLSIVGFNLFGEGLRRFLDDTQANLSRLFNRYTFLAAAGLVVGMAWILQSSSPLGVYRSEAQRFDEQRVVEEIRVLTAPEFEGRQTGTPGGNQAAEYIAARMKEIGLLPGAKQTSYVQEQIAPRPQVVGVPELKRIDTDGNLLDAYRYRQDFVELPGERHFGDKQGELVGVAFGPFKDTTPQDPYQLGQQDLFDKILIVRRENFDYIPLGAVQGVLVVADDPMDLQKRELYPAGGFFRVSSTTPVMLISPELADELLAGAGSSLAQLDQQVSALEANQVSLTQPGPLLSMKIVTETPEDYQDEIFYNIIGVIPGVASGLGLDSQVIIVSAYFDGLGVAPDGTLYPGANDNASGVAMLLELARLLKESPTQPDKTVLFVAWSGAERGEALSVTNVMNARTGFNKLNVEAVIELSGVGGGSGQSIALGEDSSYRLINLFQSAAERLGVESTTRGRSPHYGREIAAVLGGRSAMTLSVSWDGSDVLAHTPMDTVEMIDPAKLREIGETTYLTLLVMSRETTY